MATGAQLSTRDQAESAHETPAKLVKRIRTPRRVVTCYDMLDLTNEVVDGGFADYTDGMYYGHPDTAYSVSQPNQAEWLLDQVRCREGSRLMDIDCGNGGLLAAARDRRAMPVESRSHRDR